MLHYLIWEICDNAHSSSQDWAENFERQARFDCGFALHHPSRCVETGRVNRLSKWWWGQGRKCAIKENGEVKSSQHSARDIWVKALGIAHVANTWLWVWHWWFMPTNPEQLCQRMSTCDTVNWCFLLRWVEKSKLVKSKKNGNRVSREKLRQDWWMDGWMEAQN